jgi:hypothetical protein
MLGGSDLEGQPALPAWRALRVMPFNRVVVPGCMPVNPDMTEL